MDVLRSLLCIGLLGLLWHARYQGVRPIRDFFVWGMHYPFHFLLTATLILVIWGVLGADFGLQGLFLDEAPLTQILLGAMVMMLFATIIVHYSVLDTSTNGWRDSLLSVTRFLLVVNGKADPSRPVQAILRNGFLENLSNNDIEAIEANLNRQGEDIGARPLARQLLEEDPIRLLISPALLFVKGFMLVFLVGMVPTLIIPLIQRDPMGCAERLPWLAGVVLGHVLGVVLACWTTRWASDAAGWDSHKLEILASLRAAPRDRAPVSDKGQSANRSQPWLAFLAIFFIIHFFVNIVAPESVTSRWIDWPEKNEIEIPRARQKPETGEAPWRDMPWLPAGVLMAEAALACVILVLARIVPAIIPPTWSQAMGRARDEAGRGMIGLAYRILTIRGFPWFLLAGLGLLAGASLLTALAVSPEAARMLWPGLRGYASLGAVLVLWLGAFRLATHGAVSCSRRGPIEQAAACAGIFILVGMDLLQASPWLVGPLSVAAIAFSLSRTLGARPGQPTLATLMILLAGLFGFIPAWHWGIIGLAAKAALGLATWLLGSAALARVARTHPAMLYPMTVFLAFFSFAIPYNSLDERWQSSMPAAGSIACAIALIAAVYTVIVFARPRSAVLAAMALGLLAMLLNGSALFVSPNQFKSTFPNMESYYGVPVYLDSRDYFRETTPSTVRLRNKAVTEDFDRLERQGTSERLATAYFSLNPIRQRSDGGYAVSLGISDPRGRLRAIPGDEVRLSAEEWFTIRVDGPDCIALAEEPFFRKIFPWFQYESLHMIRDGIIRGGACRLVQGLIPKKSGNSVVAYDTITDGEVLGLRLRGLASQYLAAEAQYALIAMNWNGKVAEARHDKRHASYTIEFDLPAGSEPLSTEQLRVMGTWMERCHLDCVRPSRPALSDGVPLQAVAPIRPGDCLVLDDSRAEAPVPAAIYLVGDPELTSQFPRFAPHWPTRKNLEKAIASTPVPFMAPVNGTAANGNRFTLRPAHDRGLFASPDGSVALMNSKREDTPTKAALYNAGRLRVGDRVILSWNGRDHVPSGHEWRGGSVCEVVNLEAGGMKPNTALPPGYQWATLQIVSGSGNTSSTVKGTSRNAGDQFLLGEWQVVQPLNNTEVLLSWKRVVGDRWKDQKPKLVIVTVSGGGIRASVWTSVVLRKLESTLGSDFPYHIRLITGASGGMVGGSYYATSLAPPTRSVLAGTNADFSDLHGASIDSFVDRMATDQLDAVAGRMLFADIPGALSPFRKQGDRGRTLEDTWIRWTGGPGASPLGRPLQSYAADERLGWRPSMVYTPMMVEDGRRLLISNLDLAFATRNVGGLLIEPSSRKIDRPAIQGGDFDTSIHDEDDVFSLSAVEFFRLFPEARDFRVTTAVRMSASFPWVSPAISLPTLPTRRVVDAAYYDNYGVNLTALWISKMGSWLKENTSGVVVIQIRDNVSQGARTEIDFDRLESETVLDRFTWNAGSRLLSPGLQAVTTPLIGISNARQWTMAFRNDEQVDLLDLLFDDERGRDFFRTVVFECPMEVSLNWKLTGREKEILASGFGRAGAHPRDELARVKDYLIGKDSYEFNKWRVDARNRSDYQRLLKARYDEQLGLLGFRDTARLTPRQSQALYENVMKNLKRLELLADWWREGQARPRGS